MVDDISKMMLEMASACSCAARDARECEARGCVGTWKKM